jgi:hypothetical protein
MKFSRLSLLVLACAAAPVASYAGFDIGINIGGPEVVIRSQPPPDRYEDVGIAPGPGYVFIRGHWAWRHDRWDWVSGRWELPAQRGAVWVSGQWVARGGGWVWVEGHYQTQAYVAAPPPPPDQVQVEEYADEAPPAPYVETIPVAPGPDFFWIGGRWAWRGRWVWTAGHYDRHPHFHPGGGWEPGRWERVNGRYAWREGHWR